MSFLGRLGRFALLVVIAGWGAYFAALNMRPIEVALPFRSGIETSVAAVGLVAFVAGALLTVLLFAGSYLALQLRSWRRHGRNSSSPPSSPAASGSPLRHAD